MRSGFKSINNVHVKHQRALLREELNQLVQSYPNRRDTNYSEGKLFVVVSYAQESDFFRPDRNKEGSFYFIFIINTGSGNTVL